MNPNRKDDDMKHTDTMLMPGAEPHGIEINSEERNYLARHVSRALAEQRSLLAAAEDPKAAEDCFKRIAVMVNFAADIGWELEAGEGARFDLVSVPKGQLIVWVRRFWNEDHETLATYTGSTVTATDMEAAFALRSPVARALGKEIAIALRLMEALGDVERGEEAA